MPNCPYIYYELLQFYLNFISRITYYFALYLNNFSIKLVLYYFILLIKINNFIDISYIIYHSYIIDSKIYQKTCQKHFQS